MRYALVDAEGRVDNVILWDGDEGFRSAMEDAGLSFVPIADDSMIQAGDTVKPTKSRSASRATQH